MKEESCEFLIIGNGLQETCLCALLNIWNHRAICIEYPGHICISSDTSEYLFEDVIIQQDHPISTRIKIQFDPNNVAVSASDLIVNFALNPYVSNYLSLQRVSEPFVSCENELFTLPTDKESLMSSHLTVIQKRFLLQFLTAAHQLIQYWEIKLSEGKELSLSAESQKLLKANSFEGALKLFRLDSLFMFFSCLMDIQLTDPQDVFLRKFQNYFDAKTRIVNSSAFLVLQNSYSDVVQTLQMFAFSHLGLVFTSDRVIIVEQNLASNYLIIQTTYDIKGEKVDTKINYQRIIQFRYQEDQSSNYKYMLFQESSFDKSLFPQTPNKSNYLIFGLNPDNKKYQVIIRQSSGGTVTRGFVSFEFINVDSNVANQLLAQMKLSECIVYQKEVTKANKNSILENVEIVESCGQSFEQCVQICGQLLSSWFNISEKDLALFRLEVKVAMMKEAENSEQPE